MDGHNKAYALTAMCGVLDVSISGYRAWKRGGTPSRQRLADTQTLAVIRAILVELKGAYGSPRMLRELRLRGFTAGEVISWLLKPCMTTDIVTDALTMAWCRRRPTPGVMHHSDRGSQYASHAFQGKRKEFGMTCSMSRKGNCWDNAPTESWFNSFKNERYHGLRYAAHAEIKATSFECIEVFYNRTRQHSTLGYQSPIQYLDRWTNKQNQEIRAA